MSTKNNTSAENGHGIVLLSVATLLLTGCAILSLSLRVVPKYELATMASAVVYVQAVHILHRKRQIGKSTTCEIRPLAEANVLRLSTLRFFIVTSLILSILMPWTWLIWFSPSKKQVRLLGPHLFVMMTQVLFEIWSYRKSVSLLVRVSIPVAFVGYRLRIVVEWIQGAAAAYADSSELSNQVMLALACANLFFWSIMLFYVLLLKVCPPYFGGQSHRVQEEEQSQKDD